MRRKCSLSQEEVANLWTLLAFDINELKSYRKEYRLFVAIQLCSVRLYGKFLLNCHELPTEVTNYLCRQLDLPPALSIKVPVRKATIVEQRQNILAYLGFKKFEGRIVDIFQSWVEDQAKQGKLPDELLSASPQYLLDQKIILPGQTIIERMVINICNKTHAAVFEAIYQKLTPDLCREITKYLEVGEDEQKSYFNQLKEYPPSARAKSIKQFLRRYERLKDIDFEELADNVKHHLNRASRHHQYRAIRNGRHLA